jgi:hypothetical protein
MPAGGIRVRDFPRQGALGRQGVRRFGWLQQSGLF